MAQGIALLSMYNDEDDDDDLMDVAPSPAAPRPGPTPSAVTPSPPPSLTPPLSDGDSGGPETLASPVPRTPPLSVPRSPPPPEVFDAPRGRGALGIVDYAHDDTAMSPEAEEGEIVTSTHLVTETTEIRVSEEHLEERTLSGTFFNLTSGIQPDPPQPSGFPEQSEVQTHIAMEFTRTEVVVAEVEVVAVDSVETQKDDPLSNFLPPPLTKKCPEDLQEKINKFLSYKKAGKSFNADLRNRKDYRNPDFLQHAVRYQDIDQIGTCFSKDVFDPHGYDKSDYYDELEADMKREIERKDQERKKSQKVEFIPGGTHSATAGPPKSTQIPVTGVSTAIVSGLQSVSTTSDGTTTRHSRKSKWDKVDGDVKPTLQSGGLDDRPPTHGAGYSAFAQQKRKEVERKEAEDKKSNERKFDKRS